MENVTNDSFNRELNISWVDEDNLPEPDRKIILKHYFSSLIVYGIALLFIWFNPFFSRMLAHPLKETFNYFYLFYMFGAPIIYICFRPKSLWRSHNLEIVRYLRRILTHLPRLKLLTVDEIKSELGFYLPKYYEKQALVLIFIKVFFGTQMLNSVYINLTRTLIPHAYIYHNLLTNFMTTLKSFDFGPFIALLSHYGELLYSQSITILFTIDLAVFVVGYFTELSIFNNKIRTVDTSFAGLFFCLMCYPPFFAATNGFLGWYHNDFALTLLDPGSVTTWVLRIISMFFLLIYVGASVALGTKASNLTNRGTVSRFPYNIVRHPAYISKTTFWFFTTIQIFFINVNFGAENFSWNEYLTKLILTGIAFVCLVFIYYFRALTEEWHLIQDPEYQEYCKKVKYRFIPYVI